MRHGWSMGLVLLLVSCSSHDAAGGGKGGGADGAPACVDGDARCGTKCSALEPCASGLHCASSGVCEKACVFDDLSAPNTCSSLERCTATGECAPIGMPSGSPLFDGGSWLDGSLTGPSDTTCADTVVRTNRVIPTVMLIVDQSGSMDDDFGDGGTRWNVLRDFLLQQPDGLIDDLQSQVSFGLAMYSARSLPDSPLPDGECPIVTTIPPALDNFDAIAAAYRANEPIDDTPTGDSIEKILQDLNIGVDPDAMQSPLVFVLATDGEPDRCEELDPQTDTAKDEAIAAVQHAFTLGVRTFVISVGNEVGADHQQAIANAGLGRGPGDPDAEYWVAGDDQSLRDALRQIVGAQVGCDVKLQGKVTGGNACAGHVLLNGTPLQCDDPDGWELVDPEHIRLRGAACDQLKQSDDLLLDVKFPCNVTIVI